VATDFLKTGKKKFKSTLPTWKEWHEHMNSHLFHLSYDRVKAETQWTGYSVNGLLLDEFQAMWRAFLLLVIEPYTSEFNARITEQSAKKAYEGLNLR
jgi:hypothetical protein